jgi:hypothetical protein
MFYLLHVISIILFAGNVTHSFLTSVLQAYGLPKAEMKYSKHTLIQISEAKSNQKILEHKYMENLMI